MTDSSISSEVLYLATEEAAGAKIFAMAIELARKTVHKQQQVNELFVLSLSNRLRTIVIMEEERTRLDSLKEIDEIAEAEAEPEEGASWSVLRAQKKH